MKACGPKEAIVDVAEKSGESPSHGAYNLTLEGTRNYEARKMKTPSMDSGSFLRASEVQDSDAVNGDTIVPTYEVVNVRVE